MTTTAVQETDPAIHVAIQGERGSFSDQAAGYLFPGYTMHGFEPFDDAFGAILESDGSVLGVIPVENSIRGEVPEVRKLLAQHAGQLSIVGEISLEIHLNLIGLEGADAASINTVHSHHVALAQCARNIDQISARPQIEADTAGSVDVITALGDPTHAAVASARSLDTRTGVQILQPGFEDDPTNTTRFLVLQKGREIRTPQPNKTSLIVAHALPGRATAESSRLVTELDDSGVQATRLHPITQESRPLDPAYYVDVMAGMNGHNHERLVGALRNARARGLNVTVLGSYQAGETINPDTINR